MFQYYFYVHVNTFVSLYINIALFFLGDGWYNVEGVSEVPIVYMFQFSPLLVCTRVVSCVLIVFISILPLFLLRGVL